MVSTYTLLTQFWPWYKALLLGIPFAFAWVVVAWSITDKSVLRRPYPYIGIFLALFIEKIYWALFYTLYPISYRDSFGAIEDALNVGNTNFAIPSAEWLNLFDSASYLFIIIEFIVAIVLFGTLWYLARPKDFTKLNIKRIGLVVIGAILMTVPLWIWKAIAYFGGLRFFEFFITNWEWIYWYNFLFHGIPIAIAMVIFAFVITNIKSRAKFFLYVIILVSVLIPHIPIYDYMFWVRSSSTVTVFSYFFVFAVMFFVMFLSLLLLSKTKYIEQ